MRRRICKTTELFVEFGEGEIYIDEYFIGNRNVQYFNFHIKYPNNF